MKLFEVKQSELKQITLFLIDKKVVLHPKISPDGSPDFTGYENREVEIILDRNLFVYLISLLTKGELNDNYKRKLISSLMFWIEFNGFNLNASIALTEYATFKNDNEEANKEHNIFNNLFVKYSLNYWLDLAISRRDTIPKLRNDIITKSNFHIKSSHFEMHYLEMLKLAQLFYNEELSIIEKFNIFFEWVYENIIICSYTTCLCVKIFSGSSKVFNLTNIRFSDLNKICINQAWDLTYLSIWSTLYWYENKTDKIYLFATADKELREIFVLTNKYPEQIFTKHFKKQKAEKIKQLMNDIYLPRAKRKIDQIKLNKIVNSERNSLENQINKKYGI